MSIETITNHHRREVLDWFDLTEEERQEFTYYTSEQLEQTVCPEFVRYKGRVYDLSDLMPAETELFPGWDVVDTETFFSGVLFRWPREFHGNGAILDMDHVICGRYFVTSDLKEVA